MPASIKFNHKRGYEWLLIAQSYFQCALISARILNKRLSKFALAEGSYLEYCLNEIYGNYPQEPAYLIFPILFNFKHGIEIYLKSIIGTTNSEFPKNHNLLTLLEGANIEDEEIKHIIDKYALGHLFLPTNQAYDTENQFERYPQGSAYDSLELFPTINDKGEVISIPQNISIDDYLSFIKKNNAETIAIVNQEKIRELISDIEFLYKSIRQIARNLPVSIE